MTIIVRTDGSDHSARAVGPAHRLARLAGGTVLEHAGGASSAGIEVHDRSTDSTDSTVCVATRRIGRSGVLRCVNEVGAPTLCIGPRVQEPPWHPRRGLLVCLDGTPESERALAPARRWAALLGEPITLLTVTAERRPAVDGAGHRFHFGPLDPAAYLGGLADELRADGATVSTVVLTDPLSAASALRRHLRLDRSSLVVTSTSSRTNLRAVLLRSVAATIVDTSRVPVLVVPSITNPALT